MALTQTTTVMYPALRETRPLTPGQDLDSTASPRPRVLVIDDDLDFIDMTKMILCQAGFDVAGAAGCLAALEKCAEVNPDVILLDLMMPEVDGYTTFQKLRQVTQAPVIMVTASGDRDHAAKSLTAGLEDYISKPFYNPEMVTRIQAVLRRARDYERENIRVFPEVDFLINLDSRELVLRGRHIRLVPREFAVLSILVQHAPKPVGYAVLTETMWGEDTPKQRSHLKNIIFSLRQKLEADPSKPKMLVNYRSLGYQLITRREDAGYQA